MSAIAGRFALRARRLPLPRLGSGISAIVVKELRGRMRGKRAFIVVTIHVLVLAVFAWMFMRINEESISAQMGFGAGPTYASAGIGRGIFLGLLLLQTLMIAVLAPAATAGAISSEREHQTLDLLAVTPISSLAIVLGKLLSGLAWVFVLILASIPVTALVFVFGGVAPDDVIRGYIVLFATVIGLGSVGLFFSTLTRRTGASTGLTFVATIALVVGTLFVYVFMSSTAETTSTGIRRQPPEALLYLNPFVAQVDVACGTEDGGIGGSCGLMSGVVGAIDGGQTFPGGPGIQPVPMPAGGVFRGADGQAVIVDKAGGRIGVANIDPSFVEASVAEPWRDRFWPKSVLAFLFLATVMTLASVQFVTPTRRWRPSLPGPVRRLIRRRSA
jgi:ABC-2 type transport system permease protein